MPGQATTTVPKRRWWQYRLSTMLAVTALIGIFLAVVVVPAERQRRSVEFVGSLSGGILYGEMDGPSAPEWVRNAGLFDYWEPVIMVTLVETKSVTRI